MKVLSSESSRERRWNFCCWEWK